jgi:uncharacterized membrane protein (UPF0127 family)
MMGIAKKAVPLACLLFSGCLAALPGEKALPVADACLLAPERSLPITLEIAESPGERRRGLMERESLPAEVGMLFVYDSPRDPDQGFWMYRTLIPLDIAYLDSNGIIRAIRAMEPCPAGQGRDCPVYTAGVSFSRALEMNQGYFESKGVTTGDRLSMDPSDCR